jgi:hypothetical protein
MQVIAPFMFVVFSILNLGCAEVERGHIEKYDLGNGLYKETFYDSTHSLREIIGQYDDNGKFTGQCKVVTFSKDGNGDDITGNYEIAEFRNGLRHGKSVYYNPSGTALKTACFDMGVEIPCSKAAIIDKAASGSFDILKSKYPWFYYEIIPGNGNESELKAYLDTIDTKLNNRTVEELKFDNSYNSVLNETNNIPEFKAVHNIISSLTKINSLDVLKDDPLRLAVIDHYRSGMTTFHCIETTYPAYLKTINDNKISNSDFQGFCRALDSLMVAYGTLNLNDPVFFDSTDIRLYRAIKYFYSGTKSAITGLTNNDIFLDGMKLLTKAGFIAHPFGNSSVPKDVAKAVMTIMLTEIMQADLVYYAVRESYFTRKNWVLMPTVTTGFMNSNSQTSVTIRGNVIGSGGASVTSRGITWAATYNPTISDHIVTSGMGTGEFLVSINDLIPGVNYYARAYATNSKGTSYGNVISFKTKTTPVIDFLESSTVNLKVFPNPASYSATFSFSIPPGTEYQL